MGAYDFYQTPIDIDELGLVVRRAFHVRALEQEDARLAEVSARSGSVLNGLITTAPEMLKVARTIERVAGADVSVMLLGASGTGKEVIARGVRSEEHTSELQSLMRHSYAVFCLKKKNKEDHC